MSRVCAVASEGFVLWHLHLPFVALEGTSKRIVVASEGIVVVVHFGGDRLREGSKGVTHALPCAH